MSEPLYLDDCAYAKPLASVLRVAGHPVATPFDAGISGRADEVHLRWAAENGFVLITKNPDDFARLHNEHPDHAGILVIYQDNDPDRDMTYADIVRAISNIKKAGLDFRACLHVLNAWRY